MKTKNLILVTTLSTIVFLGCKKKESEPEPTKVDQQISGEVSGTWVKNGTYRITDDIFISEGKSLTIEEGVTVLFSDTTEKPEIIVKGNLYSLGTAQNPVKFTVEEGIKAKKPWGQLWGGIISGPSCTEMVIQNTIIEYGGATTTEASASVKGGLYKAASGENVPVLYFNNVDGKLVFMNNTVRNFAEDGMYLEGGKLIISGNTFYTTGITGGDAINIKSGVLADVSYNLIYSPNTNALKLSNTGSRSPQAYVVAYNNTIINAGWRRPSVKGGSVWVEQNVRVDFSNNLLINNRFGVKRDTKNPEDNRSTFSNNHYYGYTQQGVDQFQTASDIIAGTNDIISNKAQENNPKLENFDLSNDQNNATYTTTWDFHLKADAPGLNKGKTDVAPHFKTGLVLNGITYSSPASAAYIGAFGTK